MQKMPTRIWCCLVLISMLFLMLGCAGFYKKIGFTPQEAASQVLLDNAAMKAAIEQGRILMWELVSAGLAGVGTITTVLLGKWIKTERAISAAVIRGVEKADKGEIKTAICKEATSAGIEAKLNKRVNKLT